MEYHLCAENCPSKLSKVINDKLEEGWELYGHPTVVYFKGGCETQIWHYQAVIKHHKDTGNG